MQDWELLQEFVKTDSQAAFGQLVERHLNFVYSTCLREIGDSGLAEDATQAVFLLLWQKARTLRSGTLLTGWLFQTARFVSKNARKQEVRWRQRTYKAAETMMHEVNTQTFAEEDNWTQIQPLLHDAMGTLSADDRNAVLLRCYEGRSLKATGEALGVSEEAARKRVSRALEKLRTYFSRHGVTLSVVALGALLSSQAVQAAPASLAAAMSTSFLATATASSAATLAAGSAGTKALALAENARRTWLLLKLKAAATAVCGLSLVAVGTQQVMQHQQATKLTAVVQKPTREIRVVKVSPTNVKPRSAAVPKVAASNSQQAPIPQHKAKSAVQAPQPVLSLPQQQPTQEAAIIPRPVEHLAHKAHKSSPLPPQTTAPAKSARFSKKAEHGMATTRQKADSTDSAVEVAPQQVLTREEIPSRENERNDEMQIKKTMATALAGAALMASALAPQTSNAAEGDKGTVTGILTAKGENWIEVKADDAKEASRYVPNWVGGLPKDGGGPDKAVLEAIKKLRVPNRVTVNWAYIERLRVLSVEMIEPTEKTGTVEGVVTAKGENWVEVKAGDAPAERYSTRWLNGAPDKDALSAIAAVNAGDKVRLEWSYQERLRIVSLQKQ